jgi:plasmid stabilization system protein ParE
MPHAFPLVPRLEHRGVRQRGYGRYLIFYRVTEEAVEILHVAHGARDYIRALFGII